MIRSWAFATFTTPLGAGFAVASDTVALTVAQVAGADVEPPRVSTGAAGAAVVFAHTLTNVGNGPDSFTVSAVSSRGWAVTVYRDVNADGILDAGDSVLAAPVALGYAGVAHLLVRVAVPNNAGVLGVSDTVTVTARSRFDPAATDLVRDRVDVPAAPVTLSLTKQVDKPTAVTGDVLTYTLAYAVAGGGVASSAQLADTIPAGVSYVPGTLRWNGAPLTDGGGDDAGSVSGTGVVLVNFGGLASGTTGTVTFQTQVAAGPARTVANGANTVFAWAGGTDTARSNTVQTAVLVPALSLAKQLTTAPLALVGQPVRYTLSYANGPGAAPVQNVVVIDTLPAGLVYVNAAPTPSVAGQVLSWSVGTLAAGDGGVIDLVLAVAPAVRDTVRVRNVGVLETQGAPTLSAAAAELALVGPSSAALGLDLTAGVLQVAVGDAIPFTATVHNTGIVAVAPLQVAATLPAGARYVPGSAIGVDSAVVSGGRLLLFTAGSLPPGASRPLRYVAALASAPGTVAETRATASGAAATGRAVSPEAIAWVQVRREWPMETRAAIGKVWVDADNHRLQRSGDMGLGGIDVWTEDGLVATTDSVGKFSFTNLRPGRHVFRIDPRSVPADYQLVGEDIRIVEASGWTTPHVDFRVVPLAPRHVEVRHPVQLSFLARPLHGAGQGPTASRVVQYEVTLRNPCRLPVGALVSLEPWADSAVVLVADSPFTRYTPLGNGAIPLPERPGADVRVLAWTTRAADSATALIRLGHTTIPVRAQVHNPLRPVTVVTLWDTAAAGLPPVDEVPPGVELELVLEPTRASWPGVAYSLADGWQPVAGSVRVGGVRAADPIVTREAGGQRLLHWRFAGVAFAPVTLRLSAGAVDTERVTVSPARTAAQRDADHAAAFLRGPGIDIFAPADGAVLGGDRAYIGVKGEPNATVVLFDGAQPLDTVRTRIDGVLDFVAVPLARGPHRLRVAMRNSWGQERWDSVAVHVAGVPARFDVTAGPVPVVADGRSSVAVDVRVLDKWAVPVVQPAYVTVSAKGAEPLGRDADPSSVGLQLLSTATGRLMVELRSGRDVGPGALDLKSGDATATVALKLLPEVRGLTVVGSGMVGVGASPDAYGAITARGRLDDQTSLTLGLDSRRLNDGRNVFGRSADPLEESQYPILGDASRFEARTASRNWVSARLERGFDWAAFGDLSTTGFASGLTLAQYRRAVTGLAAQLTTGAVTWSGFGSLTSQALRQLQLRGAGISGPYQLAADMLPGTEYLRIETRALDNPERAVATQALTRFVDYQIDYTAGVVLFKQPIPAADANGNPVFIVGTFEAASAGAQQLVAGGRATLDVRRLATGLRVDSLRVGVTVVDAEQATNGYRLVGGDVRMQRFGAFDAGAEVAYAEQGDSSGIAATAKGSYHAFDGALTLGAGYMRVGREFTNPANVALQPGLSELSLKGGLKVGATELVAEHSEQRFQVQGVNREHNRVGLVQSVARGLQVEAGVVNDELDDGTALSRGTAAEFKTKWGPSPKLQFWNEARRHLSVTGPALSPDVWGFGASYRVTPTLALEASQRYVSRPDSQGEYAVSSVGVRADVAPGTQAYGNYQLSGGVSGAGNAALVGLRNRLQLAEGFTVNLMFERRIGVGGAAAGEPVRALPFLQPEEDYWSAAAGVELLPKGAPYRLSARGEYKDGTLQSSRLATVAGDIAFDASLALLSRQEFSQNARPGAPLARRLSSLWGLAFRPARTDRLNMLAKFQWTDDRNPIGGGVLVSRGAERKLIGAAELIWTPAPTVELGTRYAMRRTEADQVYSDGTPQTVTAWADYIGSRISVDVTPWLSVRGDGRVLVERTTGATRWDGSPALAARPVNGLEVAAGYRFGNLRDPDFSVRGGHGFFVTLSASLTEKRFPTAADFWRSRL